MGMMVSSVLSMRARRRVDWPLILHAGEPLPAVRAVVPRSDLRDLAVALRELSSFVDADDLLRRAVESAREVIGVERAAIFLIDPKARLMMGTWGTDLHRRTVDEHHVMCDWSEDAREAVRRATDDGVAWTLVENCPIVEQLASETRVSGRSWVACTPIFSARRPLGMMFNDAGRSGGGVDEARQGALSILCTFVGALLERPRLANPAEAPFRRTSPLVADVVQALAASSSLSAATLARQHGVSVSRLARAFKLETGMSIVEHRNRLRLRRFFQLVEGGQGLLPAALGAGFGSYAQFHRVFRAEHKRSPGVYLGLREPRKGGQRRASETKPSG
jgi:AraC-like DNA-binding protein